MIYLRLFFEFFKTGLFAFGGGMATVPFLSDMAARTGWFTQDLLADMLAVSESTPGPIGVNMATYVGYTVAGIPGGVVATLGLVTPPLLVILLVAAFLNAFRSNRFVEYVFYGVRPASVALIAAAGLKVVSLCLYDGVFKAYLMGPLQWKFVILAVILWLCTNVVKPTKKLHPVVFVAASAAVGVLFRFAGA